MHGRRHNSKDSREHRKAYNETYCENTKASGNMQEI